MIKESKFHVYSCILMNTNQVEATYRSTEISLWSISLAMPSGEPPPN